MRNLADADKALMDPKDDPSVFLVLGGGCSFFGLFCPHLTADALPFPVDRGGVLGGGDRARCMRRSGRRFSADSSMNY